MKTTDWLLTLIESYQNGNVSYYWEQVRKLSRKDRSRLVALLRSYASTKIAFEHAQVIIEGEF